VSFSMLMNLVAASNADSPEVLWGFIGHYMPGVTRTSHPKLDRLVGYAIRYYHDFVLPTKRYREPTQAERDALHDLRDALSRLPEGARPEEVQTLVYDIGRREPYIQIQKDGSPGVKLDWFNMLYQVLLGQEKGPRFGSFVAVYGVANAVAMIDGALARSA
jgi:lysyl-tRNA synthetase, class I